VGQHPEVEEQGGIGPVAEIIAARMAWGGVANEMDARARKHTVDSGVFACESRPSERGRTLRLSACTCLRVTAPTCFVQIFLAKGAGCEVAHHR
jgi:hypothetical protein